MLVLLSVLLSGFPAVVEADSYHPPNAVSPSQTAAPTPSEIRKNVKHL